MEDLCVRTRNYQLEMFERSMKENIIVAVSLPHITGNLSSVAILDGHRQWQDTYVWLHEDNVSVTEKIYSALLRIAAELERGPSTQVCVVSTCKFLAPC
jgi:hypothetical protein